MEPFDIAIIACVSVIVALIVLICLCRGVHKKKEQKRATILSGWNEQKRATTLSGRTYGGAAERGEGMVSSGRSGGDGMAFPTGVAIAATAALTIMSSDLDGGGNGGDGGGG